MNGKNVILIGTTGMVGGCVLQICLNNPEVLSIKSVGRRASGTEHGKLIEVLHENFLDYTEIADVFNNQDVALYCLGAYTGTVPDEEFKHITVDYTLAFAAALHKGSPQAAFCLLSGQGADQTEQSRMSFARYKGAAEKGLLDIGFPRVHIFRPGYIYPVTKRKEPNLAYSITRVLYPALRRIYPNIGVPSDDLARAMVHAGLYGSGEHENPVLENRDIKSLVSKF